jgi:hypothetical protein
MAAAIDCSYTNDGARGPKSCQAATKAKSANCRIKTHLPRPLVHKAGSAKPAENARLARLYTNGIFRFAWAQRFAAQRGA